MSRLLTTLSLAALPLLAALAPDAAAQPAAAGWQNQTIRCESNDNRQRVCATGWRDARLVRQLSRTNCVEGHNWGSRNGQIWVTGGCRAEFAAAGRPPVHNDNRPGHNQNNGVVRCESNDNRRAVCRTGWRDATLTRQLSRTQCIEGRNWGRSNGQVWVDGGCRAEFVAGRGNGNRPGQGGGQNSHTVTCSSDDNRTRSCDWPRRAGRPVLVEQLSRTACVENRTWGYNGNAIWVSNGCRARFAGR